MTTARIGVVVSTLGRARELKNLAADLAGQTVLPASVVVVNQSEHSVEDSLRHLAALVPVTVMTSPRGASKGRNLGAREIAGDVDYLFFPNDTSRLDPDFLEQVSDRLTGCAVAAVTCIDEFGPRYRMPSGDVPLNLKNVWKVLEWGLIVRVQVFQHYSGYDESLGTGAESPWQCGEAADFLLRLARDGAVCRFMPEVSLYGRFESVGLTASERRRKLRAYGRGFGYLLRRWDYSGLAAVRSIVGAVLLGVRHPQKYTVADGLYVALGRVEGYAKLSLSSERPYYAVLR